MNLAKHMEALFVAAVVVLCSVAYQSDSADIAASTVVVAQTASPASHA